MNTHIGKQFVLDGGIDAYGPSLASDQLKFLYLDNLEPRFARLMATKGYELFQNLIVEIGESVIAFGYYQLSNRQFCNFYAFTETSIYWFDFATGLFNPTPIYTGFKFNLHRYVILPWFDCMYVTKFNDVYVKVERKTVTEIDGPSARYGIIANSHAYLAGVGDRVTNQLARLRWSDLDDPESWDINPAESEADLFDLEPDSRQATGLSYQRGSPITYTENQIWIGRSVGFPGGFRHEPLFTGIGNIFHDSVVRNKEVDYFIGQDNFYELNGLQLVPIGDQVYERFRKQVRVTSNTSVPGYADSVRGQVFWNYTKNDGTEWSIVYNYIEKKWSERNSQGIEFFFDSPRGALRGYLTINETTSIIDETDDLIDDPEAGFPFVFPQLVGAARGYAIGKASDGILFLSGLSAFQNKAETYDFFFGDFAKLKEVVRVDLEYTSSGSPNLTVQVGTRNSLNQGINWSAALPVISHDGLKSFFMRSESVGRYVRFRFAWRSSSVHCIHELYLLSIVKVEDDNVDNSTK